MTELTAEIAREFLRYDPETGDLFWRKRDRKWFKSDRIWKTWNTRLSGNLISYTNKEGYIVVSIFDIGYLAHRVIWFMETEKWPNPQIDHDDGNPANNIWDNLKEVNNQENNKNRTLQSNNTSGVCGVRWCKRDNKWRSEIKNSGKKIHLGCFTNINDAIAVRKAAEVEYGFHKNHGRVKA